MEFELFVLHLFSIIVSFLRCTISLFSFLLFVVFFSNIDYLSVNSNERDLILDIIISMIMISCDIMLPVCCLSLHYCILWIFLQIMRFDASMESLLNVGRSESFVDLNQPLTNKFLPTTGELFAVSVDFYMIYLHHVFRMMHDWDWRVKNLLITIFWYLQVIAECDSSFF